MANRCGECACQGHLFIEHGIKRNIERAIDVGEGTRRAVVDILVFAGLSLDSEPEHSGSLAVHHFDSLEGHCGVHHRRSDIAFDKVADETGFDGPSFTDANGCRLKPLAVFIGLQLNEFGGLLSAGCFAPEKEAPAVDVITESVDDLANEFATKRFVIAFSSNHGGAKCLINEDDELEFGRRANAYEASFERALTFDSRCSLLNRSAISDGDLSS